MCQIWPSNVTHVTPESPSYTSTTSHVTQCSSASLVAQCSSASSIAIPHSTVQLEQIRGRERDITFSPINHRIEFGQFSTIAATNVSVVNGKAWYEVKVIKTSDGNVRIGWATDNLTRIHNKYTDKGVGDVSKTYAFDPVHGSILMGGSQDFGGKRAKRKGKGKWFLGVALDLVEQSIRFSVDGDWNSPGTFCGGVGDVDGIDKRNVHFPALSAHKATLEVNVGDRPFVYGPPDAGYNTLTEILIL